MYRSRMFNIEKPKMYKKYQCFSHSENSIYKSRMFKTVKTERGKNVRVE